MFYLNSTFNFGIPPVFVFQLEVYYKLDRLLTIGEYSAKKNHFFPSRRKNCEKEVEKFSNFHFFGKRLSRLAILGGKIPKIYKFGGKN